MPNQAGKKGGFVASSVGQAKERVGAKGASKTFQGGPPAEGFHKVADQKGTAVASKHAKYEHLGRFKTGKPRAGVGKKNTVTPAIANC